MSSSVKCSGRQCVTRTSHLHQHTITRHVQFCQMLWLAVSVSHAQAIYTSTRSLGMSSSVKCSGRQSVCHTHKPFTPATCNRSTRSLGMSSSVKCSGGQCVTRTSHLHQQHKIEAHDHWACPVLSSALAGSQCVTRTSHLHQHTITRHVQSCQMLWPAVSVSHAQAIYTSTRSLGMSSSVKCSGRQSVCHTHKPFTPATCNRSTRSLGMSSSVKCSGGQCVTRTSHLHQQHAIEAHDHWACPVLSSALAVSVSHAQTIYTSNMQ